MTFQGKGRGGAHLPAVLAAAVHCFQLGCVFVLFALLKAEISAEAFTTNDAGSIFNAYSNAYYSVSGTNGYFKNSQTDASATYFWGQAEEIECVIDAYEWTSNSVYRGMITNLLNGFLSANGSTWHASNGYNDDNLWAIIAFLRGGQDAGMTNYCNLAKADFDAVYARAWSTNLGGGLYWEYPENASKNACVNGPGAIAAYLLYKIYGDTNYWNKATNIYYWERSVLFNTSSGGIADNIGTNGVVSGAATTYNQGTFIGAADFLGQTNDAMLAAQYTENSMTGSGILPQYGIANNNSGFNAIFFRWMARFIRDYGLQTTFQSWVQNNANAAWNARRSSDNLSWCQWEEPTPVGTNLYSWDCIASMEALQVVPPTQSTSPGTVTLTAGDASGASSFNSAGNWSNATVPTSANNYVVAGLNLRTPADAVYHDFTGGSLLLTNGGALRLVTQSGAAITVGTMLSMDNGIVAAWNRPATLAGVVSLQNDGGMFDPQSFGGFTVSAAIGGTGGLTVASDNDTFGGTLILAGNNTYTGGTVINGPDTLMLTNLSTLGSANGSLTFNNNGNGLAIPHTAYSTANYGFLNLNGTSLDVGNLTGNGGEILNTTTGGGTAVLTVGNGNNGGGIFRGMIIDHITGSGLIAVTKMGTGTITLSGTNSFTGGTLIVGGALQMGDGTSANGAVIGGITNNAELAFANPFDQNYSNTISGSGVVMKTGSGTLTFSGTNTYTGGTTISGGTLQLGNGMSRNGVVTNNIVNNGTLVFANPLDQSYSNIVSGLGALVKLGAGKLTLSQVHSYTGNTAIGSGTLALVSFGSLSSSALIAISNGAALDVSGRVGQTLTISSGQALTGGGSILGKLNAVAGSIVNPGDGMGTLIVQSNITLGGTLVMELNRTNVQNSDELISSVGVIAAGGTLTVTNLGPGLQPGDVFRLFNVPVSGFTAINLPDAAPYGWANNLAVNGTINVAVASTIATNLAVQVANGTLTLSWPADHTGWQLQCQTNLLTGTNWVDVSASTTTNQVAIPLSANGSVFFRLIYIP